MTLALRVLAASLLVILTAAPLRAQQETVPLELVQHLLSGFDFDGGVPRLLTGALPEPVSGWITPPPGARVIGSAVFPRSSQAVISVPGAAASAVAAMQGPLLAAGWSRPTRERREGFVSGDERESAAICGPGGDALSFFPRQGRGDAGATVMVMHMRDGSRTECGATVPRSDFRLRTPIPSLLPPPGVRTEGGGVGGGSHEAEARTRIRGTLSPAELVRHYATQLREHGWRAGPESSAADHAAQSWTVTDAEGETWHGLLAAYRLGDGDRQAVRLYVARPQER